MRATELQDAGAHPFRRLLRRHHGPVDLRKHLAQIVRSRGRARRIIGRDDERGICIARSSAPRTRRRNQR